MGGHGRRRCCLQPPRRRPRLDPLPSQGFRFETAAPPKTLKRKSKLQPASLSPLSQLARLKEAHQVLTSSTSHPRVITLSVTGKCFTGVGSPPVCWSRRYSANDSTALRGTSRVSLLRDARERPGKLGSARGAMAPSGPSLDRLGSRSSRCGLEKAARGEFSLTPVPSRREGGGWPPFAS